MNHAICVIGACGALVVFACQVESPAGASTECNSDANCALSGWTAECCPRCKPFSGTQVEVATMEQKCTSMSSPVAARCEELKCPPREGPDYFAKCVAGRCVVGP